MKQVVFALGVLLLISLPSPTQAGVRDDERAKELQRERERLVKEKDPVDRAKIDIKISELLLDNISDCAQAGDLNSMEEELTEYATTIQNAHQVLVDSGRNAQKKSGGFKELEIALRRHLRKFDDVARTLTLDQRKPLETVKNLASGIRDRLMKALFP